MSTQRKSISPLPPLYDKNTKILILGSHPSVISQNLGFYYMNGRNRFWKILSFLLKKDFLSMSILEKSKNLLQAGIGLHDVVYSCNIHASSDATIKDVIPSDIGKIMQNSQVKHIFINGKTAYSLFKKYFSEYIDIATVLPSTSPANASFDFEKLIDFWSIITKYL